MLSLDIKVSVVNGYITPDDQTGNYNASTNPGGWGAPNPTKASVSGAEIVIYLLTQGEYPTSAAPYPHLVQGLESPPYEFITTWQAVPIDPSVIDVPYTPVEFPDGVYFCYFGITTTSLGIQDYYCPRYFVNLTDIDCCIEKMATNLCGCDGNKDYYRYMEIKALRESIIYKAECINDTLSNWSSLANALPYPEMYTRQTSYYQDLVNMFAQMKQLCKEGGCDAC